MNITVSCRNTCPFPRHLMDRTGQDRHQQVLSSWSGIFLSDTLNEWHVTQTSPWYSQVSHPCVCSPLTPPPQSSICTHHHMLSLRGPNLDETNGRNLDKCTDEKNNYLLPEGSFSGRWGWWLEDNLSWWILTGLVEWGFMCPFHFHSACPCKSHLICCPANVPRGRHSGGSPASAWLSPFSLRFVWTFNTLKVHAIHSTYVGQHSYTFILNRISLS